MPWPMRFGPPPRMTTFVGRRATSSLGLVGRVEVRRLRRRTRRRRCRRGLYRPSRRRAQRAAHVRSRVARTGGPAGRRRSRAAWRAPARERCSDVGPAPVERRVLLDDARIWSRNHGSIAAVARVDRPRVATPRRSSSPSLERLRARGVGSAIGPAVVVRGAPRQLAPRAGSQLRPKPPLLRASAAPSAAPRGTCGRWPSPRRPTASGCRARRVVPGELLERQARHLRDDVVDRRLEAGAASPW